MLGEKTNTRSGDNVTKTRRCPIDISVEDIPYLVFTFATTVSISCTPLETFQMKTHYITHSLSAIPEWRNIRIYAF